MVAISTITILVITIFTNIQVKSHNNNQSQDDQGKCVIDHLAGMKMASKSESYMADYPHSEEYRNSHYLDAIDREKLAEETNLAQWYDESGQDYKYAGDNIKALEMFEKAAPRYEQEALKYRAIRQYSVAAQSYLSAAECYIKLNNPEMNIKMREKAGLEYETEGDTIRNSGNPSFAWYYYQKAAETFGNLGNIPKAIEMYIKTADGLVIYGDRSESWKMRQKAERLQESQK